MIQKGIIFLNGVPSPLAQLPGVMLGAGQLLCKYVPQLKWFLGRKVWCVGDEVAVIETCFVKRMFNRMRMIFVHLLLKAKTKLPQLPHQLASCPEGSCQFVWMEVCTKLASAALVSVPWVMSSVRMKPSEMPSRWSRFGGLKVFSEPWGTKTWWPDECTTFFHQAESNRWAIHNLERSCIPPIWFCVITHVHVLQGFACIVHPGTCLGFWGRLLQGRPLAFRSHHCGHGVGHRHRPAVCTAAGERSTDHVLRVCLGPCANDVQNLSANLEGSTSLNKLPFARFLNLRIARLSDMGFPRHCTQTTTTSLLPRPRHGCCRLRQSLGLPPRPLALAPGAGAAAGAADALGAAAWLGTAAGAATAGGRGFRWFLFWMRSKWKRGWGVVGVWSELRPFPSIPLGVCREELEEKLPKGGPVEVSAEQVKLLWTAPSISGSEALLHCVGLSPSEVPSVFFVEVLSPLWFKKKGGSADLRFFWAMDWWGDGE